MSAFNEALKKHDDESVAARNAIGHFEAVGDHLIEISGDPRGSSPVEFFGDEGAAICAAFIREAESRDWAGSEAIALQTHRRGGPIWTSLGQQERRAGLFTSIRTHEIANWRGYQVGVLQVDGRQSRTRVMLCDDGKLRCERDSNLFTISKGEGFGALPDPRVSRIFHEKDSKPYSQLSPRSLADVLVAHLP